MNKLGQLALIGIGLGVASQFFSGGEASPPRPSISKAERCTNLGKSAGMIMGMRQLSYDQQKLLTEFPGSRGLITRAYAIPRTSQPAEAAANFRDLVQSECNS